MESRFGWKTFAFVSSGGMLPARRLERSLVMRYIHKPATVH